MLLFAMIVVAPQWLYETPPWPTMTTKRWTECDELRQSQAESSSTPPSPDLQAYDAAYSSDSFAAYRDYLSRFRRGACRWEARAALSVREAARRDLSSIHEAGPAAARRLVSLHDLLTASDFPPIVATFRAGNTLIATRTAGAIKKWRAGGVVAATWDVAEDGFVENCRPTASSGYEAFDRQTCRLITRRMRYAPARDATGMPARSNDSVRVHWDEPGGVSAAPN